MTRNPAHSFPLFEGRPTIMGVLNVTRDSFSDGGKFLNKDKAIDHALQMVKDGADIIDVGGESTRPGAKAIDIQEEIDNIVPVIEALRDHVEYISIDTRNSPTMRSAIAAGANILNDISALIHDSEAMEVAAASKLPIILMHIQNTPVDMQKNPQYNNVVEEVFDFLKSRIEACKTRRIDENLLICDPGIGFGKTLEHNLLLLGNIKRFQDLGVPIMLGASRKGFIGKIAGEENPENRLGGSIASVLWGSSQGVKIFRVHDVKETVQAVKIYQSISDKAF